MTEAEWPTSADPVRLLAHLNRLPGDRKLLLYAVACCRAHRPLLTHSASREAVDWAEQFADGEAVRDEDYSRLEYVSEGAAFHIEAMEQSGRFAEWFEEDDWRSTSLRRLRGAVRTNTTRRTHAAYFANALLTFETSSPFDPTLSSYRSLLLTAPLRDIFGNPFRPVAFAPERRSDTAVAIAQQMYESRDFSAMPILADALQDAGCDSADVLDHCRQPGEHVRGCWAVDLVLGRA